MYYLRQCIPRLQKNIKNKAPTEDTEQNIVGNSKYKTKGLTSITGDISIDGDSYDGNKKDENGLTLYEYHPLALNRKAESRNAKKEELLNMEEYKRKLSNQTKKVVKNEYVTDHRLSKISIVKSDVDTYYVAPSMRNENNAYNEELDSLKEKFQELSHKDFMSIQTKQKGGDDDDEEARLEKLINLNKCESERSTEDLIDQEIDEMKMARKRELIENLTKNSSDELMERIETKLNSLEIHSQDDQESNSDDEVNENYAVNEPEVVNEPFEAKDNRFSRVKDDRIFCDLLNEDEDLSAASLEYVGSRDPIGDHISYDESSHLERIEEECECRMRSRDASAFGVQKEKPILL